MKEQVVPGDGLFDFLDPIVSRMCKKIEQTYYFLLLFIYQIRTNASSVNGCKEW